jgi:hypothetical protein
MVSDIWGKNWKSLVFPPLGKHWFSRDKSQDLPLGTQTSK